MKKIEVNQLVVVSHVLDATIYRVKAVEGFNVGVIDAELNVPNQAIMWYDRGIFMPLSIGQMKFVAEGDLPS